MGSLFAGTTRWFVALTRCEWTSDPGGVGSTFTWVEEASGRTYVIEFEWEPPFVLGFSQVRSARKTGGEILANPKRLAEATD